MLLKFVLNNLSLLAFTFMSKFVITWFYYAQLLYHFSSSMIFGDVSAVHAFSYIHNSLVLGLVLPFSSLPAELCLTVIDDQVTFAPRKHLSLLWQFCYRYSFVLKSVGFKLQDWTDDGMKSFAPSQSGVSVYCVLFSLVCYVV